MKRHFNEKMLLSRSRSSQAIAVCVADMSIFAGTEPKCEEGQIFSFQPNRWGNQQLPILVTSYFCDFNAPIVQNESGVACVYKRRYNAQTQDNNATK